MALQQVALVNTEVSDALEVLRAFIAAKYFQRQLDAHTMRCIDDDIAAFRLWRLDVPPIIVALGASFDSVTLVVQK